MRWLRFFSRHPRPCGEDPDSRCLGGLRNLNTGSLDPRDKPWDDGMSVYAAWLEPSGADQRSTGARAARTRRSAASSASHRFPSHQSGAFAPVADLGLEKDIEPRLETLKVSEPPQRQGGAKVENVDELISKLKEAGRI